LDFFREHKRVLESLHKGLRCISHSMRLKQEDEIVNLLIALHLARVFLSITLEILMDNDSI
jgi:hypothetical protein